MKQVGLTLIVLFLMGFPWGLLATRSWLFAAVSAPLWTGLTSVVVVTVSWLTGTTPLPWFLIAGLGGWLCLLVAVKKRGWPEDAAFHPKLLLASSLFGGLTLLGLRLPPVGWDARSCWWFRATWLFRGGDHAKQAFANPALNFACKDYPPFSSAAVAGSWFISGSIDYKIAQVVSATITFSAVLLLVLILRRMTKSTDGVGALLLAPLILGINGIAGEGLTNGFNDLLWAAAFVGAALCFLPGHREVPSGLGPLLLTVTALTKNEGVVVTVILVCLLGVYRIRSKVPLLTAVTALSAGAAWQLVVRSQGMESDMADFAFARTLTATQIVERGRFVLLEIWRADGWIIWAGIFLFVICADSFNRERRRLLVGLPILSVLYLVALWATYVFLSGALKSQLEVSLDRATVFPKVLSLTLAAIVTLQYLSIRQERRTPAASSE